MTVALIVIGATAVAAIPAGATQGSCRGARTRPTSGNLPLIRAAIFCLIDGVRESAGERPLRMNPTLESVARAEVAGMIRYDYFADILPSGRTPDEVIKATRFAARAKVITGEDIGWGTGRDSTPEETVAGWLASPPHREILLYPSYQVAGVGVTPAIPPYLRRHRMPGATYAVEFAARYR